MFSLFLDDGRYVSAYTTPWSEVTVAEHDDFLVVNKPSGVPSHCVIDNFVECVPYQLELYLGGHTRCFVTSRLDTGTSGLLILAKTAAAVGGFNKLLRERLVQKVYRAVCHGEDMPLGKIKHLCRSKNVAKRSGRHYLLRKCPRAEEYTPEGWTEAELIVLWKKRINESFVECDIQIVTGRTHQVSRLPQRRRSGRNGNG